MVTRAVVEIVGYLEDDGGYSLSSNYVCMYECMYVCM